MMTWEEILAFHGHECPGIAMGYRMARAAMARLDEVRSEDEEIVAIVENDACGVDALQCITGCTFGKGNLIFRDYGKQVYTLFSRQTGAGVRVHYHGRGTPEAVKTSRRDFTDWILSAPEAELMAFSPAVIPEPEKAQRRKSITCAACGEAVMDTRIQLVDNSPYCIPCAEKRQPGCLCPPADNQCG